jgi:hypothetical protein
VIQQHKGSKLDIGAHCTIELAIAFAREDSLEGSEEGFVEVVVASALASVLATTSHR